MEAEASPSEITDYLIVCLLVEEEKGMRGSGSVGSCFVDFCVSV